MPGSRLSSLLVAAQLGLLGCAGTPVPAASVRPAAAKKPAAEGYALAASSRLGTALGISTTAGTATVQYATEAQVLGAIESANAAVLQAASAQSKAADVLAQALAGQKSAADALAKAQAALDAAKAAGDAAAEAKAQAAAAQAQAALAAGEAAAAKAQAALADATAKTAASQATLTEAKAQAAATAAADALARAQAAFDAATRANDGVALAAASAAAADAKAQNAAAQAALVDAKANAAALNAGTALATATGAAANANSAIQKGDAALAAANAAAQTANQALTAAQAAQAAVAPTPTPAVPMVSTLVGSVAGFADGAAGVAKFDSPNGIDVDAAGNLYVADAGNNRIRKVAPDGTVTTIAGGAEAGFVDGAAGVARFKSPYGVAVAADGTVYIADTGNHAIRAIGPDRVVRTLAGDGTAGMADGDGAAARFKSPFSVAIGPDGAVYVADAGNHCIRKVTAAGRASLVAGGAAGLFNGPLAEAKFQVPNDLAFGPDGKLYVVDAIANNVRAIDLIQGAVSTLAGSSLAGMADGRGYEARFNAPSGLAVDRAGNVLVADTLNHALRRITPVGIVLTLGGGNPSSINGIGREASFSSPSDVVAWPNGGSIVSDTGNHMLREVR